MKATKAGKYLASAPVISWKLIDSLEKHFKRIKSHNKHHADYTTRSNDENHSFSLNRK